MSNNSRPFNIVKPSIKITKNTKKGNKLPITKKPVKGIQLGQPGTQSGTSRSKKGY